MTIHATCTCGKKYALKDELAGKRGKCNACGQAFVIPQPTPVEEIVELEFAPQPQSTEPQPNSGLVPASLAGNPQPLSATAQSQYSASSHPGLAPLPAGMPQPGANMPGMQAPSYGPAGYGQPGYAQSGYPLQQPYPQQGYPQQGQPQPAYPQPGQPYSATPMPGAYDPLSQSGMAAPGAYGAPVGTYGAPPPKPAGGINVKQMALAGVGIVTAIVVGSITFVATQSMFKPKKPTPIATAPPTLPVGVQAPMRPPVQPMSPATPAKPSNPPAQPTSPPNSPPVANNSFAAAPAPASPATPSATPAVTPVASFTAAIDAAPTQSKPVLVQPLGIELNPTDVERLTLGSASLNKAIVGSRKENKGKLLIYDLAEGKKLTDWEAPKYGPAIQITSLSPNGEYFAFSTATQETEVWSLKENKQLAAFKAVQGSDGLTSFVAALDNGRLLTGSTNGTLTLWSFPGENKVWSKDKLGYFGFNTLGGQLALSPNHKFLAFIRDGQCELIDVESGALCGRLAAIPNLGPQTSVSALAFNSDGKCLAGVVFTESTRLSTVALWNLSTGGLSQSFPIVAGQQLDIPPSFIRRPNDPKPTWKAGSGTQKAVWWGDQHLLLGNRFVVDLASKQIVARLNLAWGGIADRPLGDQLCYASGMQPHQPGQLTALTAPVEQWQPSLTAYASGQSWLKPGVRVGLNLQLDGPPTDAPVFRDLFTQQLKARLSTSGVTTDGAPELSFVMQTRTEETQVVYRVHGFGRVGPPQEVKGRRLIATLALNSAQGQPVWNKELRYDPPFAFSSNGQEDFAAAQLNAHWTTLSQDVLNLFPWCLPKDAGGKPLPLDLTLQPGGVK